MKTIISFGLCLSFFVYPVHAQVSESTAEWPVWKQISVGTLGATAVLATVATIGAANADTDGGDSNSDTGESQSGANDRKSQGYVEELKDELLVFMHESNQLVAPFDDHEEALDSFAENYPVLINYYRELGANHPEVIEEINRVVDGNTTIDRLNTVMLVHLFGSTSTEP